MYISSFTRHVFGFTVVNYFDSFILITGAILTTLTVLHIRNYLLNGLSWKIVLHLTRLPTKLRTGNLPFKLQWVRRLLMR